MENQIEVGAKVILVQTSRYRADSYYDAVVSRVTKARVWVQQVYGDGSLAAVPREFERGSLTEYGTGKASWARSSLVIDPAKMEEIRTREAATKARKELEARGSAAAETIARAFDRNRGIGGMTEADIQLIIALGDAITTREAEKSAIYEQRDLDYAQRDRQVKALVGLTTRISWYFEKKNLYAG